MLFYNKLQASLRELFCPLLSMRTANKKQKFHSAHLSQSLVHCHTLEKAKPNILSTI